jgi:hypothetical protein
MDAAVTESEKAQYRDFIFNTEVPKTARGKIRPPVFWHYTTGDGLLGIVGSGRIWATQISCLNDAAELRYPANKLIEALQRVRADRLQERETQLVEKAILGLSADPAPSSYWCVASFSEEPDDLSQWRAYGGGEGGYAVGFDSEITRTSFSANGHQGGLVSVCYNTGIHDDIAASIANATLRFFREGVEAREGAGIDPSEWTSNFLDAWAIALTYVAPLIKHPKFEGEKEWRIIRMLQHDDVPNLQYRQRQSLLARYLPLALPPANAAAGSRLLPICGVRIGPSRHQRVSAVSVNTLLRGAGYPEDVYSNVSPSEVPFQAP